MRRAAIAAAVCALMLAAAATPAQAGRQCDARPPDAQGIARGMQLAQRTAAQLDASGAQVVLLARAGQDLSRWGLRWSHLGWAWRTPQGQWRVTHKLNDCGTASAHLWRQGLGEFFLDDPWRYEAVWAVPTPAVQAQLLALLQDAGRSAQLHQERYSMVSYAWGTRYQQSNQWAVETLAAAVDPQVRSRGDAQRWLRQQGYVPTALSIGPLTRLGARVTSANVAFDDHPSAQRLAGHIETVTVDSVLAWLERARLAQAPRILALDTTDLQ